MTTPTRYRKKPVEIEARRLDGTADLATINELAGWCGGMGVVAPGCKPFIVIDTLEGTMKAADGDWIIRGVNGEFYPCKPDIFAATYEPVERS